MAFRTNAAPYQRAKRSTLQIMIELLIALVIVWVAAVVYTFKEAGSEYGIKSILMMVVAVAVTAVCDVLTTIIKHKKDSKESLGKEIVHDLVHNYSWVTAVIFTLTLPVWASYYIVIIGSIFATVVVKNLFGGFGKNIFNPAIMARIFVGLCFAGGLNVANAGLKHDSISGATITTIYNGTSWLSDMPLGKVSMTDLFLGNYFGSLGETFTILILVLGVVLCVRKVINWRTPVFYLGTVVLTSLVIALVCGFENPLTYVGYHVALGGLAFGAVFMLTDPVTGPTSSFGKSLIAVVAGLLTVLIRVKGGYPEGVMYSIAFCNLISPAVDYVTVGKTNAKLPVKYGLVFGLVAVSIALCTGVAWNVNGGKEVYSINGIPFAEYTKITEELGFDLKDGHQLSAENVSDDETYIVVDASGNKVASVYLVTLDKATEIADPNAHGASFTMKVYVAIDVADNTIYDVAFVKGATGANWLNGVTNWATDNVVGKDQTTIAGLNATGCGATFSAGALQTAIEQAYALHSN